MVDNKEKLLKKANKYNIQLDDNLKAVLKMKISDDSDFLSKYYFDDPIISQEVGDYLLSYKGRLSWKKGIKIEIISDVIDDAKHLVYERAIRNYFINEMRHIKNSTLLRNILSSILFLLGILTLVLMFVLDFLTGSNLGLWKEVIDIVAWVFIWESVDLFIIQRLENNAKYRMFKNVTNADIVFTPLTNKTKK